MSDGITLKLYIKPGCPWCMQVTTWLDAEGYQYRDVDVIADDKAFEEMIALSGQSLAPTLVVTCEEDTEGEGSDSSEGLKILPDFGVDELKVFFAEHGIKPST